MAKRTSGEEFKRWSAQTGSQDTGDFYRYFNSPEYRLQAAQEEQQRQDAEERAQDLEELNTLYPDFRGRHNAVQTPGIMSGMGLPLDIKKYSADLSSDTRVAELRKRLGVKGGWGGTGSTFESQVLPPEPTSSIADDPTSTFNTQEGPFGRFGGPSIAGLQKAAMPERHDQWSARTKKSIYGK